MGDIRALAGLLVIGAGVTVLGLSYFAAYALGRSHGRRDEQVRPGIEPYDSVARLAELERTVGGLGQVVERVVDSQRLLRVQQEYLGKKANNESVRLP